MTPSGRARPARRPTRAFRPQHWNADNGARSCRRASALKSGPLVVEPSGEVFGDLTNAAARVQSAAGPGSILITATVQRQTTGLFVAED